jgi:PAS domain S-box-containing protein
VRVFWKDRDLKYLGCNLAFARDAGFEKPEDLAGEDDFAMSWREQAESYRRDDRQVIEDGEPRLLIEEPQTTPSDEMIHLLTSKVPLRDAQGAVIGVLGTYMDITERKRAEEALKDATVRVSLATKAGGVGVWEYDLVHNRLQWDEQMYTLYGISRENFGGAYESWRAGVHPEDIARSDQEVNMALSGEKEFDTEFRVVWPDGTVRHIQALAMVLRDEDGKHLRMIGTNWDITELKRAEEEKVKLQARLQQAQKMEAIGSLAGGIAHDLNNILFPISGLSEILLDDIPPDNPARENIEQIYRSSQRGSELVKQILAFSRQSSPKKLPIRIQPILKEALKLAQATIPRNIEIISHINTDCGMVSADPTQIHQIVMNLITNAYHAVEQTGGTINLELKETEFQKDDLHDITMKSGKYACISISDTGTGIDKTLIDKIFDPYFTTKELGKGTGLGLSVVHGIVKEHGGDIRVYSEVGKGTVFHVYLPLLEDAMDSKTAAITRKYPTGHERILLVDDEEPIMRMEQMMLERLGYQVTTRISSPDALAAFKANPDLFDLVISDRGMPNMTGDQLAGELISIRPGIPIILCTGFSNDNDVKRAKAMGVKGFLMKPVAIGDLAAMVRKVLDDVEHSHS